MSVCIRKFLRSAISTQVFLVLLSLQANARMVPNYPVATECSMCSPSRFKVIKIKPIALHIKIHLFKIALFEACNLQNKKFADVFYSRSKTHCLAWINKLFSWTPRRVSTARTLDNFCVWNLHTMHQAGMPQYASVWLKNTVTSPYFFMYDSSVS
jgi:hypothetical protein